MTMTLADLQAILKNEVNNDVVISENSSLHEIGLDSLDMINFLFSIEEQTSIKIPDEMLLQKKIATVSDIIDFVNEHKH